MLRVLPRFVEGFIQVIDRRLVSLVVHLTHILWVHLGIPRRAVSRTRCNISTSTLPSNSGPYIPPSVSPETLAHASRIAITATSQPPAVTTRRVRRSIVLQKASRLSAHGYILHDSRIITVFPVKFLLQYHLVDPLQTKSPPLVGQAGGVEGHCFVHTTGSNC